MLKAICPGVLVVGFAALFACGGVSSEAPDAGVDGTPDPCLTNSCECEVDSDCDSFEVCDTESTPGRICVCAPAYADNGSGCAFAEAPGDPGFSASDVWVPSDPLVATLDPTFDTAPSQGVDVGIGQISPQGTCDFASYSQTFTMPPRDRSEVFAVDVSHTASGSFGGPGLAVEIGGGWHFLAPRQFNFATESFCLGDAGYGGDVRFSVSTNRQSFDCETEPTISASIDRFAVRKAVANECPDAVGEAINGDAEGDSGWAFATQGDGAADYEAGVGAGNSRGIRLTTMTRCSQARATTKISLPAAATMGGTAIELFASGNNPIQVLLGDQEITRFVPTNAGGIRRVCVPDWAKGTVQELTFGLPRIHSSGDCSPLSNRRGDIDALSVVSEPACGESSNDYDLGFETPINGTNASGWAVITGAVNGTVAPANIRSAAGEASDGNGSLRATATNRCNESGATRTIVVPEAVGAAGPAVKAMVNVVNAATGIGELRFFGSAFGSVEAPELVGYSEVTLCLPPKLSGRPLGIGAFADGGGGGCSDIPAEVSFFDQFLITTDASCPAQ